MSKHCFTVVNQAFIWHNHFTFKRTTIMCFIRCLLSAIRSRVLSFQNAWEIWIRAEIFFRKNESPILIQKSSAFFGQIKQFYLCFRKNSAFWQKQRESFPHSKIVTFLIHIKNGNSFYILCIKKVGIFF